MDKNIITVCGVRFDLSTVGGSFGRSHNEYRHCSRCELPLTDPASWERGVGPVCARKDTNLYAKTIPVNFTLATAYAFAVNAATLPPELQPIWKRLLEVLIEKAGVAGLENANFMAAVGQDVRSLAKMIDWMLSFRLTASDKNNMIHLVKYLGFVGLASVLAGNASTGEAKVWFENGRCYLKGSSNKGGWAAFRGVQGSTYPRRRGSSEPYSVPATFGNRFVQIVSEFWPCIENSELEKVADLAKQHLKTVAPAAPVVTPNRPQGPSAMIRERSDDFTLQFDWVSDKTPQVVLALKKISPSMRNYDPNTRTWSFRKQCLPQVRQAVDNVYVVTVVATREQTPVSQYRRSSFYGR